jgi:hypothetical protein
MSQLSHHSLGLYTVLVSPVDRIVDSPLWARALALLIGGWQFATNAPFAVLCYLVVAAGIVDYWFGVKRAKLFHTYDPSLAHRGAMGKIAGVALVLFVRVLEAWLLLAGLIDTHGALATGLAVSLVAVDLQSVAHHREAFGAPPIPFLSALLEYLQRLASSKIPPPKP